MFKSILKKRDGAALVVVLLLLMVFSISYGGAVYVSNKNIEGSVQTQKYTQTYYSSESGINVMVELIKKEATSLTGSVGSFSEFKTILNGRVTNSGLVSDLVDYLSNGQYRSTAIDESPIVTVAQVSPVNDPENLRFNITSKSDSRTLETAVEFSASGEEEGEKVWFSKYALISSGNLNITGLTVTGGPIATTSMDPKSVTMGSYGSIEALHLRNNLLNIADNAFQSNYSNCKFLDYRLNATAWMSQYNPCQKMNATAEEKIDLDSFNVTMVMPAMPVNTGAKLAPLTLKNSSGNTFVIVDSNGNFSNETLSYVGGLPADYNGKLTYRFPQVSETFWNPNSNKFETSTAKASDVFYVPSVVMKPNRGYPTVFDVGDRNITIITDYLDLGSRFTVEGTGTVTFIVTASPSKGNNINFSGNSEPTGNPEDAKKIIIYVYGKNGTQMKSITIGGSASYYVSIMGEYLNASIGGSGGLFGNFISGGNKVSLNGGSTSAASLFYLSNPNAVFEMSGSGKFKGAVITHDFSSSGGSSIQYDASVFENIPFEITMPNFVDGVPAGPSVVSMVQDPVKEK